MNVKSLIIFIFLAEGAFLFASYSSEKDNISIVDEEVADYIVEEVIDEEPISQKLVLPQSGVSEQSNERQSSTDTDCSELFGVTFHELGSEKLIKVENGFIDISNAN